MTESNPPYVNVTPTFFPSAGYLVILYKHKSVADGYMQARVSHRIEMKGRAIELAQTWAKEIGCEVKL